jgi:hypothetical protein
MVFTYGNVLYNELKIRGFIRDFSVKEPPIKNVRLLDDILSEMNITKCTIRDVERNYPSTILHLEYLLQFQHDIIVEGNMDAGLIKEKVEEFKFIAMVHCLNVNV